MSKNFIVFAASSLGFLILGWGLMFGNGNGVFGTVAVGLFARDGITGTSTGNGLFFGGGFKLLGVQLAAVGSVAVFVFIAAVATWLILKAVMGIRVSREEELRGLDI
ncbi:MAG: ammonium transporter, partial [Phycisphaerae bacterium]|nr:ammonium transporter [Phycisphaerae bacterium]